MNKYKQQLDKLAKTLQLTGGHKWLLKYGAPSMFPHWCSKWRYLRVLDWLCNWQIVAMPTMNSEGGISIQLGRMHGDTIAYFASIKFDDLDVVDKTKLLAVEQVYRQFVSSLCMHRYVYDDTLSINAINGCMHFYILSKRINLPNKLIADKLMFAEYYAFANSKQPTCK